MSRIVIVPADVRWPDEYAALARRLKDVLGELMLDIEHIGSTAVPGLAAKDVIDVQVGVRSGSFDQVRQKMEEAHFHWRPEISSDHFPAGISLDPTELQKRVATEAPGERRANVHFRVPGRFNYRYALLCRDFLRANARAADAYALVKQSLALLFPDDVDAYYAVKDPVFDLMMVGAEAWARAVDWERDRAAGLGA